MTANLQVEPAVSAEAHWQGARLHNVAEVVPCEDGVRLLRIPEKVRLQLNERARLRPFEPWGVELQCVIPRNELVLEVSSEGETRVSAWHGDFLHPQTWVVGRNTSTLSIRTPERMALAENLESEWDFAPQVTRVAFHGDAVRLHRLDSSGHRAPFEGEMPAQRLIVHGTSITSGVGASFSHLSYAKRIADAWGVQLINLGIRGSAHCDPAMAEYIASRMDWQAALLELSVNMLNIFTPREFEVRLQNFIQRVSSCRKPLVCLSLLPHFRDLKHSGPDPNLYRDALCRIVDRLADPLIVMVDGSRLLSLTGLSADLLHPSDIGHAEIARNLLRLIPKSKLFA